VTSKLTRAEQDTVRPGAAARTFCARSSLPWERRATAERQCDEGSVCFDGKCVESHAVDCR
jgi:hypothetical protein